MSKQNEWQDILVYTEKRRNSDTVKKYYRKWRAEQLPSIPDRCDNEKCTFFKESLIWNGLELPLILDHIDGNCGDDRPHNLRFLCPNCDSQLDTKGGGNRGVWERSEGGFAKKDKDGKRDYTLPAENGKYELHLNKER